MVRSFRQVDDTERRLVKNMLKAKITWTKIQKITGRSSDTLSSIAKSRIGSPKKKGAAKKNPVKVLPKILKVTESLQKKAKAEKEVTANMIIKKAGLKACPRTLQNTFHKNKIWFYKLKEKPALTPADNHVIARCLIWPKRVAGFVPDPTSARSVPSTVPRQCPVQCPVQCPLEKHNVLVMCTNKK